MSDSDNNYVNYKRNCNQCGSVMTQGWSLTCPACLTNNKLDEQNKLLAQQVSVGSGSSYSTDPPPWPVYIALLILIAVIVIGFLFYPHWGIVTFVKFIGTVFWLIGAMFIGLIYGIFQMLF